MRKSGENKETVKKIERFKIKVGDCQNCERAKMLGEPCRNLLACYKNQTEIKK